MIIAPVLASFLFRKGAKEWRNPVMEHLVERYRKGGIGVGGLALAIFLLYSGVIGSESLPHLDEGALWVRGSLAPSTGPDESLAISNTARIALSSFPEVTQVVDQIGRPDDGTVWTGFFNTEYFVDAACE